MWAFSAARFTAASTPSSLFSCFSMRVAQAAQVMPPMARSSVASGTSNPVLRMVSTSFAAVVPALA
jgi:hypothetical protein